MTVKCIVCNKSLNLSGMFFVQGEDDQEVFTNMLSARHINCVRKKRVDIAKSRSMGKILYEEVIP